MFSPLYSNISKEQHEKHLCNPSSHYGKYVTEEYNEGTKDDAPWLLRLVKRHTSGQSNID